MSIWNNSSVIAVLVVVAALGLIIWASSGSDDAVLDPMVETNDASSAWDAVLGGSGSPAGEVKKQEVNKSLPPPTGSGPVAPPVAKGEKGVYVVTYTDNGFSPVFAQVKVGEAVRFVNNSSKAMMIKSTTKPPSEQVFYPGFSQDSSVGKGGTWTYLFTQIGAWGYMNSNVPSHTGTVIVLPQ